MAEKSPERWSQEVTEHSDARSGKRSVHAEGSERDRYVIEAFGRGKRAAEVGPLSFGDVDAQFLHQPRRQKSIGWGPKQTPESHAGAAQAVPPKGRQAGALALAVGRAENVSLRRHHHLTSILREHGRGEESDGAQRFLTGILDVVAIGVGSTNTLPGPIGITEPSSI